jgi:hypothetical protein
MASGGFVLQVASSMVLPCRRAKRTWSVNGLILIQAARAGAPLQNTRVKPGDTDAITR